ncbi:class I SAM-dependent methyltransferase [Dactylosporangium siamense]|uniref:Methyltransferase n=1 Tax=Dactylosporangium siamense TaxID=685454 RepID=A0A919PNA0_9ACTN|nr:class I SAM-dependent methyltransferase [Dactylosporangium siamense]GIG47099.1 methyltransferase [Dactylosporangium siamense]
MPAHQRAWRWDPSLYAGAAAYYTAGRMAYPPELAEALVTELGLDGTGTLLDVGCGPGSLTLLLAARFAHAIGVDADQGMLDEGARQAAARHVGNVSWRCLRAEDLPADLPPVDVITLAQSFHWMNRPRVAAAARRVLHPGGALVHVGATTHRGDGTGGQNPPWDAITALVETHLGAKRPVPGDSPGHEEEIYREAGFDGPHTIELPGHTVRRSAADIVAAVYSLSSSTPHLFGDRLPAFDRDLRALLGGAGFTERTRPIVLQIWR